MLVLLRLSIGWHFLYAGIDKLTTPDFSSSGFLGQSKGPLAKYFYDLVPDIDGVERLKPETWNDAIDSYRSRFVAHYRSPQEQQVKVDQLVASAKEKIQEQLAGLDESIKEYLHNLERLSADREAPQHDMPYQQKRNWDKQNQLRGQVRGWLGQLKSIDEQYKADLATLLDEQQRAKGPIPETMQERFNIDRVITYTNIAIGVCLIAGLFTRLAAFGGALFLLQVVLAQPAWPAFYPPPHPSAGNTLIVNKEFIEMMALFALATLPTGRWAGLDFFIHYLFVRPVYRQEGSR